MSDLDPSRLAAARAVVEQGVTDGRFPGAVLGVAGADHDQLHAVGDAVRYAGVGHELPPEQRVRVTTDTVFDLASISKLFTTIVIMRLVEHGQVDLDAPVATYLEEFATPGKSMITVADLLTHVSGLPWWLPLWSDHPDPASRWHAALTAEPDRPPRSEYVYSDINLISVGELAARVSGRPLDELVATMITAPLGLVDTGYRPAHPLRCAATEDEADAGRGVVRGEVHDENAWSLGGVAGHAGVFATAADLLRLGRCLLAGGTLDGTRIIRPDTLAAMTRNRTAAYGHDHGLGFEVDQPSFMGALAGPRTFGHTGFTGTSLVVDPDRGLVVVLLTNRVHPTRDGPPTNPVRAAVGDALAGRPGTS